MEDEREARLVELETRLAFQEDTLEKLRVTVTAQEQQLYRLTQELKEIRAQVSASSASPLTAPGEDPPPPHY